MTGFSESIYIQAPPERVWPVMFDVERWHEWTASIKRIEKPVRGPLQVGSRAHVYQPKLLPAWWRVSHIQDGRSFTWISRNPGVVVTATHTVEPSGTGCRAILTLEYSGLLGPFFGRLFQAITQRYMAMEAAGLKQRCESRLAANF